MTSLVGLLVVVPMLAAAIGFVAGERQWVRDILTVGSLAGATAIAGILLAYVESEGTIVLRVGDWDPELGIVLVVDLMAALVLLVAMATILVVQLFAIGQRRTAWGADPQLSGPLLLVLTSGVVLAFLTGDLFTLFVAFELILVSSYVLLTHQGRRGQIRSGMTYVAMNLFASTLFLVGLAVVYASTGTVNLACLPSASPNSTIRCDGASACGSSLCSAPRPPSSRCSRGFPTVTRRRPPRSPPCSPAC